MEGSGVDVDKSGPAGGPAELVTGVPGGAGAEGDEVTGARRSGEGAGADDAITGTRGKHAPGAVQVPGENAQFLLAGRSGGWRRLGGGWRGCAISIADGS